MPIVIYVSKVVVGFAALVITEHVYKTSTSWYKTRKALKTA